MKRTVLPERLQEKLRKLITNLNAWRNTWFISLLVTNVVNNMWIKQLTLFATGRIITDLHMAYHACKNTYADLYEQFCDSENSGFLNDVSVKGPNLPFLFKKKLLEAYIESICTIWPKHKRKCLAVSLLILISFTWIAIICIAVTALTHIAHHC